MDFELLVRYAVPGTLALLPVAVLTSFDSHFAAKAATLLGIMGAASLLPLGYVIHQVWFMVFSMRGGYVTERRPNLAYLLNSYRAQDQDAKSQLSIRHVYYAWETWVYGPDAPERHLQRARRLWQLYHGLSSSVLGALLGIAANLLFILLGAAESPAIAGAVSVGEAVLAIILWQRGRSIRAEVDNWELLMVVEDVSSRSASQLLARVNKFLEIEGQIRR
ncbi:MAG: hypothetical protein K6U89_02350 [Chloroflexi bacterium]|nr:hypothetical protein [Chloroflexota bacterium]